SLQGLYQNYDSTFPFSAVLPALVSGGPAGGQSFIESDKLGLRFDAVRPLKIGRGATLLWGLDWVKDKTLQALVDGRDWTPTMDLKDYAGFVQMEVAATTHLTLRGGVRYEYLDLDVKPWILLQGPRAGQLAQGGTLTYDSPIFNGGVVWFFDERSQI